MKEKKLEIIHRMVRNGYHLMNRTAEEMASIFTLEELKEFERKYNERREKK